MQLELLYNFLFFFFSKQLAFYLVLCSNFQFFSIQYRLTFKVFLIKMCVDCDKPWGCWWFLCEEEHDATGRAFFLLTVWVHLGFFNAATHTQKFVICLGVTLGATLTLSPEGHPQSWSWNLGSSNHWAQHICSNKASPLQTQTSWDKYWNVAVPGQYRACILLLEAQITFIGGQ